MTDKEEAVQRVMQRFANAVIDMGAQAEKLGFPAAITIGGVLGGVAALAAASGLKRENTIAALNSVWDDIES